MALLITLLAGAFFLLGALVAWRLHGHGAVEDYSVAIAFGALACVAVQDLGPEALEATEVLGWPVAIGLAVAGVAVLVVLDRLLPDHHAKAGEEGVAHIGTMAVLALTVHNIAEGAAIYVIASQDVSAGLALALGVGLHNAPLGMLLFSTMERSRARGIVVLAVASLSTFTGGLIMAALGDVVNESVMAGVVCVAFGMIAYLLLAELLPAMVRSKNPARCILGVAIGIAFVLAGSQFE